MSLNLFGNVSGQSSKLFTIVNYDDCVILTVKLKIVRLWNRNLLS